MLDLDARDSFWAAHGGATFQQVAVEVKQQLADYKARIARLDALRGADAVDPAAAAAAAAAAGAATSTTGAASSSSGDAAGELGGFVSEIPELQAKKALVRRCCRRSS